MEIADEIESSGSAPGHNNHAFRWLEIALIFTVFFVAGGAPAPHVNETYYLTKAKHYWQPQWCAGDAFLESADAHLTFYWTVGWLAKFFSLPTVAWLGRVVAWLLLAISWQRLSSHIVQRPFFATLAAMLFVVLVQEKNFAGEWVVGGVEGKCFAYAFVFWGIAALVEGRWRSAWPWFGLASAFHVLVGGWSVIVAAMVWLTERRTERPSLSSMLPSLLLGGILALPGVVPGLKLSQGVSPEIADQANQIYVFQRLPHHLAPLALAPEELGKKALRFGSVIACLFGVWFLASRELSYKDPQTRSLSRLLRFSCGSLVLCLCGFAWELAMWDRPELAAKLLKYYWFRLADVAVPMGLSLAVVWLIVSLAVRRSQWATFLLLAAVAFPTWYCYSWTADRIQSSIPPADRKMRNPLAWKEACLWARENTAADSLFLIPRSSQSFEWYAHRSGLVTRKDVPQDAKSLVAWQNQVFDVFAYNKDDPNRPMYTSLAEQGTARIKELANKYNTQYVITKEYPPLQLPLVFSNEAYSIYSTTKRDATP